MQHQASLAFATSCRGPWKLIYYEAYLEQADALGREKYLKSGSGRKFLKTQLRNYLAKHPLRKTASANAPRAPMSFYADTHVLNRRGIGVRSPLD